MDMPALPVNTGAGASPEAGKKPQGGSTAVTVLQSEAVDWSVADYKSCYADCFDIRWFNAMFSDGRNASVNDCWETNAILKSAGAIVVGK